MNPFESWRQHSVNVGHQLNSVLRVSSYNKNKTEAMTTATHEVSIGLQHQKCYLVGVMKLGSF